MTETLQEFFDSRGVPICVDRDAGVIRGVKILGLRSRNGRTYLFDTLRQAAGLYEGAKVNVNHPKADPAAPRDYQDRIGAIRHVVPRRDEGLFADFHFNPKHGLAEQLIWDAEHAPENVGFSHNVQARVARRGEQVVVEAITKVQSVDLVADPATTRGLFEAAGNAKAPAEEKASAPRSLDELKREHPELVEAIRRERAEELGRLRTEVERLESLDALHHKRDAVRRLLAEFQLPDPEMCDPRAKPIVGEAFIESLLAANDERTMRSLVEERAALVRALAGAPSPPSACGKKPLAREQHCAEHAIPLKTEAFVRAIT